MPFIDIERRPQDLSNLALEERPVDPSLSATFGAAFRTQNMIGSFLTQRGAVDPDEIEDGFNAIDYVKDDSRYAPYVDEFAGITNRRSADTLKLQIDGEEADRRTLEAAGMTGFIAQMAAGVVDLPTLLPFGGAIAGSTRTGIIAGGAIGAGLDAAISETGLQATQATRTGAETALNIGGSIVLGGALGALVGRYLSTAIQISLSRKIENQGAAFDEVDRAFRSAGGSSVGAAERDVGPLVLKDEALLSKLPLINRQDPMIRLQLNELDAGRETVRRMAETPLEYADNAKGVATERGGSVETRIKMWQAPLAKFSREVDTEYAKYYHSTQEPTAWQRRLSPTLSEFDRMRGGKKMTYREFKEEVGRAAYMGGEHEIPEVASAANAYRQVDEQLKKAAIDAKLFPEDVSVEGDISHRFRMYNREKIIADRGTFKQRLVDYFTSGQQSAGFRAEENAIGQKIMQADKVREKYDQAFARLTSLEERLNARLGVRQRKMSDVERARQTRTDLMKERAPEQLVKLLRGADKNSIMIDTVKEFRKASREASKSRPGFADKYPVLFRIKERGGVMRGSPLHQELAMMDVTPKRFPGLFKDEGGIGDLDNFVHSEYPEFFELANDGTYTNRDALSAAIREELAGRPLKTPEELAAGEYADSLEGIVREWMDAVGLDANAKIGDIRAFIDRVNDAEKDVAGFDAKVSRLESEIEEFDRATDGVRNEQLISNQEAATIADELNQLEEALSEVATRANASPRVSMMVDYGRAKRDLFKAKLEERNLAKRVDALNRLNEAGKLNDELMAELSAKSVDLERIDGKIKTLTAKANKLEGKVPSKADMEKTDEFANLMPGEIENLADETINQILGHAEGRVPYDIVSGPRGALKERLLKIETAKIHDFVENDIENVMTAQMRTMSADIELSKKFGSVDLKEQIRKINDEADAKIARAETPEERQRLEKSRVAAIRDVEGIRDRLRGTYALPSDPSNLVLRAGRVARNLNYMRLLGGMTLSAIPDMGSIVFQHGLVSTFRDGFLPLVSNFKAFRLAAEEVKAAGTALDMVLDTRTMAMADVFDNFGRNSKFERFVGAASSRFGLVSLMAPWNATLKQLSGLVVMTRVLNASERVAAGTASADDLRRLAASGIDADMATRIAGQYAKHGDAQGGVLLAKAGDWEDASAMESFRAAVVREVDKTIVTPGQDKPLWMSTELGKTVGQFKSFGISAMQKIAMSGIQQRDAQTLNGVMIMLGLGAVAYAAKETMAGRPLSDDPWQWGVEAFDKSGLSGWLMEINNISEKATRGRVGLSMLTGKQVSRYASRNVVGAFLGPTADAVSDIFQVSGSVFAGDTTQADLRKMRQLLPLQNLFYIRGLLDQVEAATGSALALPEKRN